APALKALPRGTSMRVSWQSVRALLPPLFLAALVIVFLREPVTCWLYGEEIYDQEAMQEWVREARNTKKMPEHAKEYPGLLAHERRLEKDVAAAHGERRDRLETARRIAQEETGEKREEIEEFLKALGNPPTKIYKDQLPLFPIIYRLTVTFD